MQTAKKMSAKILSTLALAAAFTGVGVLYAPSVQALDCAILPESICGKADSNSGEGVTSLLTWILGAMVAVVGVAAVGGMVWAGILYLTASDNASQVKQAKTIIVDVAIGIIAFGLMFLVVNWLVPGGVLG